MKLSELMKDKIPNPQYSGAVMNDDNVLAVGLTANAEVGEYAVVEVGIEGLDTDLNAETSDKTYIRRGTSSLKSSQQRTFSVSGDRYIGDEFQDFCFSHKIQYGTGQACVVPYVYFNLLNGKGEKGQLSIIVNSDGSGNGGESAEIDIELMSTGSKPEEYTYAAS